jgi:hypothetical protein
VSGRGGQATSRVTLVCYLCQHFIDITGSNTHTVEPYRNIPLYAAGGAEVLRDPKGNPVGVNVHESCYLNYGDQPPAQERAR